jgi:hypothetical protein
LLARNLVSRLLDFTGGVRSGTCSFHYLAFAESNIMDER